MLTDSCYFSLTVQKKPSEYKEEYDVSCDVDGNVALCSCDTERRISREVAVNSSRDPHFKYIRSVDSFWGKLYNDEVHNLYFSPHRSIIRIIKSRKMTWAGNAARMREMRNSYKNVG